VRIAVVGAGAIGSSIAHALAHAGCDPVLVARGAAAAAIARDGLLVERFGESQVSRPRVVEDTRDIEPFDAVIGTLKAQDWAAAVPLIGPLVGPKTCLVPAINGIPWWYFHHSGGALEGTRLSCLDPDGTLDAGYPTSSLVGGVVYMAATRLAPGRISWPTGKRLVLGEVGPVAGARLPALATVLRAAGMEIDESSDIRHAIWMKLLGNAGFNTISALAGATIVEILDDPDLRAVCAETMNELIAVAAAIGIDIDMSVDARLEAARRLGDFRTSTLQDFDAGRPLETAALVEAPCEIGRLAGVPTPVLVTLGRLLHNAVARRDRATGP
jgi:2-dehydropantoate 2-reductase